MCGRELIRNRIGENKYIIYAYAHEGEAREAREDKAREGDAHEDKAREGDAHEDKAHEDKAHEGEARERPTIYIRFPVRTSTSSSARAST